MDNFCSTDLDGVFTKLGPRRNLPKIEADSKEGREQRQRTDRNIFRIIFDICEVLAFYFVAFSWFIRSPRLCFVTRPFLTPATRYHDRQSHHFFFSYRTPYRAIP